MQRVLHGLDGVLIYLDDILVHGEDQTQHDERLRRVLERIRSAGAGMTLNEKCVFGVSSVDFVGFTISAEGVRPCNDNLKAIAELPSPDNPSKLKSVLGTMEFYLRCVPNFSDLTEPLRRLLKQETKFIWGEDQENSFQ